jgi:hypothetical protein
VESRLFCGGNTALSCISKSREYSVRWIWLGGLYLGIPSRPHDPNGIVFFGSIGAVGVGVPQFGLDGHEVEFGVVRMNFNLGEVPEHKGSC